MHKIALRGLTLLPLILFLLFWETATRFIEHGTYYFGSPTTVAMALWAETSSGNILIDIRVTMTEVLVGFVLGNVMGYAFGLIFWYYPLIARIIRPYLNIMGSIPIIAIAPIVIILFGIGFAAKVVLVVFATFITATIQTFEGAMSTDENYIKYMQTTGASRWEVFKNIIAPNGLIWVFTGLKLNIGFAILGAFIGEFISSDAGLGHHIIQSMGLFQTPRVLAGVVVIAALSYLLTSVVEVLQKYAMPWKNNKS